MPDTFTPPPVTGYRNLTQEEIDLANEIKAKAEELGAIVERMRQNASLDQRWVSIGVTQMQLGCMALCRSVFRPTTFA